MKKFDEYYQDAKESVQTTITGPNKGRQRTDIWNIVWYSKLGHKQEVHMGIQETLKDFEYDRNWKEIYL